MADPRQGQMIQNVTALLAIQPLVDESDLSSVSFLECISATYSLYMWDGHSHENASHDSMDELDLIITLILDKYSTNKATVQYVEKPMVGAQSHWLDLAVSHWTKHAFGEKLQSTLNKIHAVMIHASSI